MDVDQIYKLRNYEGSEWFLLPEELAPEFDNLTNQISKEAEGTDHWHDLINDLSDCFLTYRIDNPFDLSIKISPPF